MKKYKNYLNGLIIFGIILSYLVVSNIFEDNPSHDYHDYSFYGFKNFTSRQDSYESQEPLDEYGKFWGVPGL